MNDWMNVNGWMSKFKWTRESERMNKWMSKNYKCK